MSIEFETLPINTDIQDSQNHKKRTKLLNKSVIQIQVRKQTKGGEALK